MANAPKHTSKGNKEEKEKSRNHIAICHRFNQTNTKSKHNETVVFSLFK